MKNVFLLSLLSITGCASILEGNEQIVSVRLEPDVAGKCHLEERHAPSQDFAIPGEVKISRSYYPLDITCESAKSGLKGQARVYSDVSSLGYTGAIASLGVGALVDAATSDAFDYPNPIILKLGEITDIGKNNMNSNVEFDKADTKEQ